MHFLFILFKENIISLIFLKSSDRERDPYFSF